MTDVIEAMCRAYWNERGSRTWEREDEPQREVVRARMRAAFRVIKAMELADMEQKVAETTIATKSVPAPVPAPNHVTFPELSPSDNSTFAMRPIAYGDWAGKTP